MTLLSVICFETLNCWTGWSPSCENFDGCGGNRVAYRTANSANEAAHQADRLAHPGTEDV